jgi:hypothetical protein
MIETRKEQDYWAAELASWQAAAAKRPECLTPIPPERWPPSFNDVLLQAWESRDFLVRLFEAPSFNGMRCERLAASRYPVVKVGTWDGGYLWEDPLSWSELMAIKAACGFGDFYGLEVYPRDADAVNLSNVRHIWLLAEPLSIGWRV